MSSAGERHPAMERLSRDECFALLRQLTIGRVAVNAGHGAPIVLPVNFALVGEIVVFRTDEGTRLVRARQHPASFQADAFDPVHHGGWSVLIQGVAQDATDDEIEEARIEPWAPGPKDHWMRIVPVLVSGRRLVLGASPPDLRAYL
jgi:nitroimidazol reductase NimA-like FMN-containing flavoprotein (pyridoxamine 5'-phosphate oxidase superfamily)